MAEAHFIPLWPVFTALNMNYNILFSKLDLFIFLRNCWLDIYLKMLVGLNYTDE